MEHEGDGADPLEQRPKSDHGDTAVPAEGDIGQQSQTVSDEDLAR